MRVTFKTDGGLAFFPGLAKPFVLDSDKLGKSDAKNLHHLVEKADFFSLPPTIGQMPLGAADMQQQTMTVEDGNKSHTVKLVSNPSAEVQALFEGVNAMCIKLNAKQR